MSGVKLRAKGMRGRGLGAQGSGFEAGSLGSSWCDVKRLLQQIARNSGRTLGFQCRSMGRSWLPGEGQGCKANTVVCPWLL